MEKALFSIKQQQANWAKSKGIRVDDAGYTANLGDNLFCPLSDASKRDFLEGRGDELGKDGGRPKIQALHSSAALAVNVFEHWRTRDVAAIARACGLSERATGMRFEATHRNALGGPPSHLDVQFTTTGKPLAIESKFTETYSRHTRRELSSGYVTRPGLWEGLPGCERLAKRLKDEEGKRTSFEYLDAPQLLKHILGLNTSFPKRFSLLYLWYGVDSEEAERHWREITEFESFVEGDVDFRVMTYQDLFKRIQKMLRAGTDYVRYLRERYFTEPYDSFHDKAVAAEGKYGALAGDIEELRRKRLQH